MKNTFALKGTIVQADGPQRLAVCEGYAVCENGVCAGTFAALPGKYAGLPVADYTGKLVVPGLVDLHVHAPQYAYRGTAMDLELLDWLDRYTFPEEAHYADAQYAQKGYADFVQAIKNTATTRAVVFGTLHTDATLTLMRLLDAAGMAGFVGKVAMDRNKSREPWAEAGLAEPRRWLDAWHGDAAAANGRVHPILTPRFTPSVTPGYMRGLGELAAARHLPVQSHLSENPKEIEWVQAPSAQRETLISEKLGTGPSAPTVAQDDDYVKTRVGPVWLVLDRKQNRIVASHDIVVDEDPAQHL